MLAVDGPPDLPSRFRRPDGFHHRLLSIVLLAVEIARRDRGVGGLTACKPWLTAFTFGLLHGFGIAGALTQIGLPTGDVPLALLSFNLGVEAGQIAFTAAATALLRVTQALPRPPAFLDARRPRLHDRLVRLLLSPR